MSPSRIGLLSPPIGNGNLGDEAIITACIQGIRRLHPTASIYVISPNPGETRARHEVETYPIRWMEDPERRPAAAAARPANTGISTANADSGIWSRLKRAIKRVPWAHRTLKGLASALPRGLALIRGSGFMIQAWQELRGTDLLIIAGSGCFCDHFGGALNFPFTIFEWSLLSKLAGVPVAVASVGAGPVSSRLSRVLLGLSLRWASYRSVREVTSREIFSGLLQGEDTPVYPDLAHGLETRSVVSPASDSERLLVGINPFPHCDPRFWPEGDPERFARYIGAVAGFAVWLMENGHRVLLFPTQVRADRWVIDDLRELIRAEIGSDTPSLVERSVTSVDDLASALGATDIVVAGRFHGILLAYRMNRPVIGIGNHHKMSDLMRSMGQAQYSLDADAVTRDLLVDRFTHLAADRNAACGQIAARVEEFRDALEHQYAEVLRCTLPDVASPRDPLRDRRVVTRGGSRRGG
jgi:polysaccharide pyruvyl transferase WcaK-like protein